MPFHRLTETTFQATKDLCTSFEEDKFLAGVKRWCTLSPENGNHGVHCITSPSLISLVQEAVNDVRSGNKITSIVTEVAQVFYDRQVVIATSNTCKLLTRGRKEGWLPNNMCPHGVLNKVSGTWEVCKSSHCIRFIRWIIYNTKTFRRLYWWNLLDKSEPLSKRKNTYINIGEVLPTLRQLNHAEEPIVISDDSEQSSSAQNSSTTTSSSTESSLTSNSTTPMTSSSSTEQPATSSSTTSTTSSSSTESSSSSSSGSSSNESDSPKRVELISYTNFKHIKDNVKNDIPSWMKRYTHKITDDNGPSLKSIITSICQSVPNVKAPDAELVIREVRYAIRHIIPREPFDVSQLSKAFHELVEDQPDIVCNYCSRHVLFQKDGEWHACRRISCLSLIKWLVINSHPIRTAYWQRHADEILDDSIIHISYMHSTLCQILDYLGQPTQPDCQGMLTERPIICYGKRGCHYENRQGKRPCVKSSRFTYLGNKIVLISGHFETVLAHASSISICLRRVNKCIRTVATYCPAIDTCSPDNCRELTLSWSATECSAKTKYTYIRAKLEAALEQAFAEQN